MGHSGRPVDRSICVRVIAVQKRSRIGVGAVAGRICGPVTSGTGPGIASFAITKRKVVIHRIVGTRRGVLQQGYVRRLLRSVSQQRVLLSGSAAFPTKL